MFEQLKQRNVHRVALAYLAGSWLLIQIVETLTPDFLPAVVFKATVICLSIGFIPSLILSWFFEWTPKGIKREREIRSSQSARVSRWLDRVIVVTLIIAVAYFAVDKFVVDPIRDKEKIEVATAKAVQEALAGEQLNRYADRSVLVLPFLNLSTDEDQGYFADGISEELLNLLAKIEELRVISRSTSWTFKGKEIDIADIQKKLDVSHILEGSVRKAGNQVRISAQLIDARTNSHLWSETYDRTLDDIFTIQDEISAMVVEQMKLELLAGTPSAEEINPEAYDLYLKGRYLTHTVRTEESFDNAIKLLSQAVELSPDYVPAIWELARAIGNSTFWETPEVAAIKNQRIRELVDRLVELAPDSSYTNGWLSTLARDEGNLQAAALYQERALEGARDSNLYIQLHVTARFLFELGRIDQAAAVARYVVDRDPACTPCVNALSSVLRKAGKHREAAESLEALSEWRELSPFNYWNLGVSWLVAGEPTKALEYFEKAPPGNHEIGQILAYYDLGRMDEFETGFSSLLDNSEEHPEHIARVAAWSRQNDIAFEYLERAMEMEGPDFIEAIKRGSDLYQRIQSDPRWQAFFDHYDTAEEEDLSGIRFNPKLPQEVLDALAHS